MNYNLDKVSILIPLYNSEQYIAETLNSALSQTWPSLEIIIVDDGSTDNSYLISKSFESQNVKVFRQHHIGASAARNFAFSKSTGDYIQYLDADDILSPDKIEKQITYFKRFGNNIITSCKSYIFSGDINDNYDHGRFVSKDYSIPLDYMVDTWENGDYFGIHAWLFPRRIVENAGSWDNSLERFQDAEFVIRVLSVIDEIKFVPTISVYYRDRPNSITSGNFEIIENSNCIALSKIIRRVVIPSNYERALKASVTKVSTSIYRWYPYFTELVDVGFGLLKEMNSSIILKRGNIFWAALNSLFGWKRTRNIEIRFEILYKRFFKKLGN